MKLAQDDIKYIDRWLHFSGINYLDVRYELVDHLINEYEQRNDDIELKVILPLVLYIVLVYNLTSQFSPITIRLLIFAPVFLTLILFGWQVISKRLDREKQNQVLAMTKLSSIFGLPQVLLSIFYLSDTLHLIDSHYFIMPCMVAMTLINIAAFREYDHLYGKLMKELEFIKGQLS